MTSHAFYNNAAPFPSRQRPGAGPAAGPSQAHPFPQPPLRSLPSFGTPNEFPNAPGHYFPSKPGAYNRRQRSSSAEEDAQAEEERRPPGPFPGAGGGKMRRGDRTTWDAGSELMRAEQDPEEDQPGEDMDMDDGCDAVSTRSKDAESLKGEATSASSGKELKKRSRTLTTAHQTAVLNALLAKTRFPSTETREEVGQQIGMSARRVQIWFQNRRQSQKRARDREASEMALPPSHHYDYQQRADPYARYPPPPSSATSTTSTVRPDLSRQTSRDSVSSRASFTSARTSHSAFSRNAPQDTLSPLSDVAPRWPGGQAFGGGWQQHPPPQQVTSPGPGEAGNRGSMFFPSAPSRSDDPSRPRSSSSSDPLTFKLPSLSSVLGNSIPSSEGGFSAGPRQVVFSHSPSSSTAANSRPPPAPSSGTRAFTNSRTVMPPSPNAPASSRPFDDFSRLRISGEGPLSPGPLSPTSSTRGVSPPDVLDAAMETVYRQPNVNPPRSSLPPLRLHATGRSEADAALLAPILPPIALSASHPNAAPASKHTLPPLSSLALATPTPPFPSRSSTWSQQSTASSSANGHTRSSVSSFETLGTGNWGPTSFTSSRTSFSSEVQEEWERMSQAGALGPGAAGAGRKVKTEAVSSSAWERPATNTVGLTSDVRMEA